MNAPKATLVMICVLFAFSLLYGSIIMPCPSAGTSIGEPHNRMMFLSDVTTPPDLDSPADFAYDVGTTGHTIDWTFGDAYPGDYRVDGNGTTLGWTSWPTNGTYPFNVDGLAVGKYNHTITVRDSYLNEAKDTVFVTVQDTTPPTWVQAPVDQTIELGTAFRYDLNATDLSAISWWVNNTVSFTIDASGIVRNATGLAVGVYHLRVNATDVYNNVLSGTFKVTVQDTTPPTWVQVPVDQTSQFGAVFRYDLNATDLSSISWWVNDTARFTIDVNGIVRNATSLAIGVYHIRVNATDSHSNALSAIFKVTVQDTTPPSWVQVPVDQTSQFGAAFRYDLNATDMSSISWWVNDTARFSIDSSGVVRNATSLVVGVYHLRVNATDAHGNALSATFKVTVGDTTPPAWVQVPVDQTIQFGTAFWYDLNATDLSAISWWINDTARFSIDSSGIIRNATSLPVGVYHLRVNVTDFYNNILSGTFKVTVQDTTAPVWVQVPVDRTIEFGTAFRYDLNATDLSSISWWVNDTVRFTIDGSGVIRNATSLVVGVYHLRVNATDAHGNVLSGTFTVTVRDTTSPTWDQIPVDKTIEFGTSFRYDLNASDLSGLSYSAVNDTTRFAIGFVDGVITNKTSLAVGVYGLEVTVTDGEGNTLIGTFKVTVQDTTPPTWVQVPVNQELDFRNLFRYDLNATDLSSISWWVNDTTNFQIDSAGVITNRTSFTIRVYGIQVNATDSHGNVLTATFRVTSRDTSFPVWNQVPTDQTIEFRDKFRYDLNASHPSGIASWWVNDTTHFSIDSNGVITNSTGLAVGVYHLMVNVTNNVGNSISATFEVTVLASTPPTWDQIPTNQFIEFGNGFRYDLNATDFSGISGWWINDTTSFAISGAGVITNSISLSVQVYGLRVNVTDRLGNIQTAVFTLTVQDTIAPTWVQTPVDLVIESGGSFRYDLNATDLSGIDKYWLNDTAHFTMSSSGVLTNSTSLLAGVYGLHVYVNDTHGNILSSIFGVTVQPATPPSWVQSPTDRVAEFGSAFRYDLNATDFSGIGAWWVNDTTHFAIDTNGVITNKTPLVIGAYGIRVNVTDTLGHIQTATFKVTVQDTTSPSFTHVVTDRVVELGSTWQYDLNATDLSGVASWSVNDTVHFSINGQGVLTNVTFLPVGVYRLQIRVNDTYNNARIASLSVTVEDTTPPVWVQTPADLEYEANTTGHTLAWTSYDLAPANAQIWRNGSLIDTLPWTTRTQILTISVDGLSAGVYNYTIIARDGSGNSLADSVWVRVTRPTTTQPTGGIGDIINLILNVLTNGYVVAGIVLAIAVASVVRGKKHRKMYEPRDLTPKLT